MYFPLCEAEKGLSGEQSALNGTSGANVITGKDEDFSEVTLKPDL